MKALITSDTVIQFDAYGCVAASDPHRDLP